MQFLKKRKDIKRDNDGGILLMRWNVFECKFFSIKIHKLISSDPGCMHDHPWAFLTFLMRGGYVEYSKRHGSRVYSRFSLLYRPANYTHRLEIHQPVWTFVITFKKVREWGFYTLLGWVPWFKYEENTDICNS